jgi:transcriptional regulator with XRE-family HTH domain
MRIKKGKRNVNLQKDNVNLRDLFIQNLRKCRRYEKISQKTLAQMCSTAVSYIGQIEIGNRFPSLGLIEKIADALKVKPYILFYDNVDEKLFKRHQRERIKKCPVN